MEKLLAFFGTQKEVAKKIGVSAACVNSWFLKKRKVPPIRCVQIEKLTDGAVTRKDLRPHDWREIWIELADKEPAENSGSLKD